MRTLDSILVVCLWIFAFTALVFEPLYYFGCNWNYDNCAEASSIIRIVGDIWLIYGRWDPLFLKIPPFLQVMCAIEVFVFGPLYAITAYGLQYQRKWLPSVALPFTAALFYSTVVYFGVEFLFTEPGTDVFMVFVINIPWSIVPVLLAYRCYTYGDIKSE